MTRQLLDITSHKAPLQLADEGGHQWVCAIYAPLGFPGFGSFGCCDELFGFWSSEAQHWDDVGAAAFQRAASSPELLSFCGLDPFGNGSGTLWLGPEAKLRFVWMGIREWMTSIVRSFDTDAIISTREGACAVGAWFTTPEGNSAIWLGDRLLGGFDLKFDPEIAWRSKRKEPYPKEEIVSVSHIRGSPMGLLEQVNLIERPYCVANPWITKFLSELEEGAVSMTGPRSPGSFLARVRRTK